MAERVELSPVRRTVNVKASPDRAFVVFTEGIAAWWPSTQHVGPTPADAVIEPFLEGRCYARADDGTLTEWGKVLDWDPPSRGRLAWLLAPEWQYTPDVANCSEVEVRFEAEDTETTRVTLEHRGFERYMEAGCCLTAMPRPSKRTTGRADDGYGL